VNPAIASQLHSSVTGAGSLIRSVSGGMRTIVPILAVIAFVTTGYAQGSPSTNVDYAVHNGALRVVNYSKDKPVIWVFDASWSLKARVKALAKFDSKAGIEGSESMCLVIIQDASGKMTERAVPRKPVDLCKYISKAPPRVKDLVADLKGVLQR